MEAKIFRGEEVDWTEPPAHYSAFSKLLINESHGSKYFDFRISSLDISDPELMTSWIQLPDGAVRIDICLDCHISMGGISTNESVH